MTEPQKQVEARVREIVATLSGSARADERFEMFVGQLVGMAVPDAVPSDHAFRKVGRATTLRQLKTVAKAADRLIASITVLHAPAIVALADKSLIQRRVIAAIELIRDAAVTAELPDDMPERAVRGTEQINRHALVIAGSCAFIYEALTGRRAGRSNDSNNKPSGPFLRFFGPILKALDVPLKPMPGWVSPSNVAHDFLVKRASKNNPNLHGVGQDDSN